MQKKIKILFFLGLFIPVFLVFKAIFVPGPAVWGDAPYFYPEGLKELVNLPSAWVSRGHNFGGINEFLWIYPLMLFYGLMHSLFSLNNDVIIRIVFYIPSILLSLTGPIIFARYLGYSRLVQFFASLFYTLNTYFILLIDGGQVGIALAYGIFPLTLLFLHKLFAKPNFNTFIFALTSFLVLWIVDIRIALISLLVLIAWVITDYLATRNLHLVKNIKFVALIILVVAGLSAYWVVPLVFSHNTVSSEISSLQLNSLLNSLLVFQPHWPNNEFGKVSAPPFYFVGIPLLLFLGLTFRKSKLINLEFLFLFLFFGFLAKGNTPPLGEIYEWLIANLPFGSALRDSTKFFIPLTLFGGILIANNLEILISRYKRSAILATVATYAYLLLLIYPALLGNLNGVLKIREIPNDFLKLYEQISSSNSFSRTAWFPSIHPLAFHTENKQAIEASQLIRLRPLASINVGNDVFNFVNQGSEFLDWFSLLGIKYLVLAENTRIVIPSSEEKKRSEELAQLIATSSGLVREDWGASLPVYITSDVKPHMFGVDKAVLVVGSEDIYQKIRAVNSKFSVGNQVFFFFEDGKFPPHEADEPLTRKSAVIVFNHKNGTDLAMSFLQRYFVSPKDAKFSQWAVRNSDDYLKWKYELLSNGIDTKEFDYSKGIAFSTVAGEKINFQFQVGKTGEYIFAVRKLSDEGKFEWITENHSLEKGKWNKEITSNNKLSVINTVALIPKDDWDFANSQAGDLTSKSDVVKIDGVDDSDELKSLSSMSQWHPLEFQTISPDQYKLVLPQRDSWIIFSDSYSGGWHIQTDSYYHWSVPAYSILNGFFVHDYDKSASIYYSGQEDLKIGEKISAISLVALVLILAGIYAVKKARR